MIPVPSGEHWGLAGKLRGVIKTMGGVNGALYAASRLFAALSGDRVRIVKYYFAAQPVTAAADTVRANSFALTWANADSPLFRQIERPQHIIRRRFEQGARCLAAMVNETELAGFLWYVIGPYNEDEVRARFVPEPAGKTAWDFDVTIMPRYRMGRLFALLWQGAGDELAREHVTHTVSRISAFNPVSLASHRRLGARIIGSALFVCVGRLQLMRSSTTPRWHLSWSDEQRPSLSIIA